MSERKDLEEESSEFGDDDFGMMESGADAQEQSADDCWYDVIIDQVEKYPCLWMTSSKEYRDKTMKGNAWKTIAAVVKLSVKEAKTKYKSAQNRYRREKKKLISPSGDEGPPRRSQWSHYYKMQRLMQSGGQVRKSVSNVPRNDATTRDNGNNEEIESGTARDGAASRLSTRSNDAPIGPGADCSMDDPTALPSAAAAKDTIDDGKTKFELDRQSAKRRKTSGGEDNSQLLRSAASALQTIASVPSTSTRLDDCDSFGHLVAAELRGLDPGIRRKVRTKMLKMIEFAAEGKNFDVWGEECY